MRVKVLIQIHPLTLRSQAKLGVSKGEENQAPFSAAY